ncbi:MAG: T9SS type A sorting domain-containing protein [Bacteroidales bacterium]|nr:T9SS type A sorting domain-containing protein [Bacteroidales bacterium]
MKTRFIIILIITLGWSLSKAQHSGGGDIGDPKYVYAKFDYTSDTSQMGHGINFTDKSLGNVLSWLWDFGDGVSSYNQNPTHIFLEPGLYDVCLTIVIQDGNKMVEDFYCTKVSIAEKGYFHLGGTVYADLFPLDTGIAYLYQVGDDNSIHAYDTAYFDFNGFYYFYQPEGGKYLIKIDIPDNSIHSDYFMPTYYGDEELWIQASTINFNNTVYDYDINLLEADEFQNGNGKINGQINYEDTITGENTIAKDIAILLINDLDDTKTYMYSNEDGQFEFSDIDFGIYRVHAEVTGKETIPLFTNLSEANPITNNIDIIIKQQEVVSMVADDEFEEVFTDLTIFPNPASDQLNIHLGTEEVGSVEISLFAMTGQLVIKESQEVFYGKNAYHIDISDLNRGAYFVTILHQNKLASRTKILIL